MVSGTRPTRRPLMALMAANVVSLTGDAVSMVAIPWFVYETTGSISRMGVVAAVTAAARVVGSLTGGPAVDRLGFRRASVVADLLSGISVAAIPLLHTTTGLAFPVLLLLVALGAFFDSPGSTARDSLVPNLTAIAGDPPERINSLYQMVPRLSIFIGPAIAGALVGVFGAGQVLWFNAASFGVSALIVATMVPALRRVVATPGPNAGRERPWSSLAAGFRAIRDDPVLRWIILMVATLNLLDAPLGSVLLPTLAREEYGGAGSFGLLISALGAGAVLSSLVFAAVGHRLPRRRTYLGAYFLVGLVYWVLMTAPPFPFALLTLFVMGCGAGPLNPILMTIRQERVEEAVRGRVFSAMSAAFWIAIPLGQVLGGVATEAVGPTTVCGVIAACYLVVTVGMILNPTLRGMERPAPEPAKARPAPP